MQRLKGFDQYINEGLTTVFHLGDSGEEVHALQTGLRKLGYKLGDPQTDGKFGPETLSTAQAAQVQISKIDGKPPISFPFTNALSGAAVNSIEGALANEETVQTISKEVNEMMNGIGKSGLAFKERLVRLPDVEGFVDKLKIVSKNLNIEPNWLLTVMYKESRINPYAVNKISGASGLIQFMDKTAQGLGYNINDIREMSAAGQLDVVEKYLKGGAYHNLFDLYLKVFYPVAIGKADDFVIGSERSSEWTAKVANQNPAISKGKSYITVADFKEYAFGNIDDENLAVIKKTASNIA